MNLADGLLKSLGVNPDDLKLRMEEIAREYAGFKSGFRAATTHFEERLNGIERIQLEILRRLDALQIVDDKPESPKRAREIKQARSINNLNGLDQSHE